MTTKFFMPVLLSRRLAPVQLRIFFWPLAAVGAGLLALSIFPALKISLFAGTAGRLAGLFLGTPVFRVDQGWLLPSHHEPVLVSTACSGTDFWLIVVALLAWHRAPRGKSPIHIIAATLLCAAPLCIAVNAVRIIAVVQAHRWFIPLWSEKYAPFFHQLTGVAVFLPSLIFLHVLLEKHRSKQIAGNS